MYLIRDILLIFILAVAGFAAFVYFGAFNVAADVPHSPAVYKLLDATRQRSNEVHAADISVPPLDDPKMIAEGAEHYDAMCAGCHLKPGGKDTEIRRGLYPQPPKLAEVRDLQPAEAFWVVKHGIKLTAMPAWGTTHDNQAIWNIVAFLQKLPGMTPEDYAKLTAAADHDHEHADHEHGAHDHAHEDHEHGDADHSEHSGDQPAPEQEHPSSGDPGHH